MPPALRGGDYVLNQCLIAAKFPEVSVSKYEISEGVAVVILEHPPVNVLSLADRLRLDAALRSASEDEAVNAIVLTGAGRAFSAGADITELDLPSTAQEPSPKALFARIESSTKPIVAVLHGMALGGGLELAMACHARVADAKTVVGLPEITLGLLPGAGGTQRLPRLVGLELAMDMMLKGDTRPAHSLRDSGLFDSVVDKDVLPTAIALARDLIGRVRAGDSLRRTSQLSARWPNALALLAFAGAAGKAKPDELPARQAVLECLEAAATLSFDEGLAREAQCFSRLRHSLNFEGLRHAFLAERRAAKGAGLSAGVVPRAITRAVVIGGGTMGTGIAMCLADAAIDVTVVERDQAAADRALATLRDRYDASLKKGRLTPEECAQRIGRCMGAVGLDAVANADLVIEAVFENLQIKIDLFKQLDERARPGALLATNTSMLDVNRIASATRRPEDVLGLHFFSPANIMRLLEVVRAERTSPEALATAMDLARRIRKTAVVAGVCEGFIGNRMFEPYLMQAGLLLDEGALPQQVDRAIEQWGMAMGPFRVCDLAGHDVGAAIRRDRLARNPSLVYSRTFDAIESLGRLGQKTGHGWYDYTPGQREPQANEEVTRTIIAESLRLGLKRRVISDDEIVDRLMLAMVNEGAKILDAHVAQCASDIDVVYVTGYGFPRWRGGPMFYADQRGLRDVLASIRRLQRGPDYQNRAAVWQPAALLERLAAQDGSFNDSAEGETP
jgi:3-hydroxyacyl-CoA dehydrogenase